MGHDVYAGKHGCAGAPFCDFPSGQDAELLQDYQAGHHLQDRRVALLCPHHGVPFASRMRIATTPRCCTTSLDPRSPKRSTIPLASVAPATGGCSRIWRLSVLARTQSEEEERLASCCRSNESALCCLTGSVASFARL